MNGSNYSAYALSKSPVQVRVFAMLSRIARYKWLLVLASSVLLLDQLSKAWIVNNLPFNAYSPPDNIVVIQGFFNIVHLGNTGAAWGIFQGKSAWLGILAITALTAIFVFRRFLHLDLPAVQLSFGLLCGGIAGNLIDRMRHGYVVDFLDFHFGSFIWPSFNVADAGIVVGVGIYVLFSIFKPSAIERKEDGPA